MTKKIDPRLIEILTKYEESPSDALWDCHGTWVAYHKAIERIAAKAGVVFDMPQIVEANSAGKTVAIAVAGRMGDRQEWSFGEAAPSNNKNAYPYAMAEKRAKDRVVLKLVGLHGLVYSEEESDDFKPGTSPQEPPPKSSAALKREDAWPAMMEQFHADIQDVKTLMALEAMKVSYRAQAKKDGWTAAWLSSLAEEFAKVEDRLMNEMEKEEA